ncbi:glycosyltransferase family 2 protein [Glutamicibacter protophormiae]|uniref:glycosyltransferase family 2 protein n=1 Tax=Glutamicibacter protophormiae TaxID=37930 RepID=UPI003323D6DE
MENSFANLVRSKPRTSVSVVLATHNRPELMRKSLASILAQEYDGPIEVIIVFDKSPVDHSLEHTSPLRMVRTIANTRIPGLAGARNTGILASTSELVGFCDDDDTWLKFKLARQVEALEASPDSEVASTAMQVVYNGTESIRLAGKRHVEYQDFLKSRMAMVHSSSLLFRRDKLINGIGLVEEGLPNSMCEDWDLLLRASKRHPVLHVDEPYIRVLWGGTSYFYHHWDVKNQAHQWMLENYPDILTNKVGSSRVFGQLAFGHAALKNPRKALRWVKKSLKSNWREPRAYLALAVASGLVSDQTVVHRLQRRGRGI